LLRDGQFLWMLERRQIENQGPAQIAAMLTSAFDRFCVDAPATSSRNAGTPVGGA
jgi:hypothetical protein